MTVRSIFLSALAAVLLPAAAHAIPITYFTSSVSTASPTELGRASRSGTPQTWTHQESYTGIVNPAVTYYYTTYSFSASLFAGAPYVDISVFDETNSGLFFVTAYSNSFNVASQGTNWLGDEGASGNLTFFAGTLGDPRYFDIVLPSNSNLVLVVNTTGAGTLGTGLAFDIAVNAYADTSYNDPVPTPEPSTWLMVGSGVLGGAGAMRRRVLPSA